MILFFYIVVLTVSQSFICLVFSLSSYYMSVCDASFSSLTFYDIPFHNSSERFIIISLSWHFEAHFSSTNPLLNIDSLSEAVNMLYTYCQ